MALFYSFIISGRFFYLLIFCLLNFAIPLVAEGEGKRIRLIVTSDIHGWMSTAFVYPRVKRKGLLHIAERIKKARTEDPELILLDAGDLIQGSPLADYFHQSEKQPIANNPFFNLFQNLGYDAVAVGNHDLGTNPRFEQSYPPGSKFSWLSANIYRNSKLVFEPYTILHRYGLKIIVLGFSTPGAQMWLNADSLSGMNIRSVDSAATFWLKTVNRSEKPDLIIGLFHVGVNPLRDSENSKLNRISAANSVIQTLKKSGGFNLVIAGHDHRLSPGLKDKHIKYYKQTPVVEGGHWGEAYIDLKLNLVQTGHKWQITSIEHKTQPASQNKKIEHEYLRILPDGYKKYMQTPLPYTISNTDRKQASACLDLLNALAQDGPGIVATMLPKISLSRLSDMKGKRVRRMDLYKWFRYENKAVKVLMSQRDIQLLNKPAAEFGRYRPPYNRVLFTHLKNDWVVSKQVTWWLQNDRFKRIYPVKISDYHFFGGGGIMPQIFLSKTRKVSASNITIRDRFFEYMQQGPDLPEECDFLQYTGQVPKKITVKP